MQPPDHRRPPYHRQRDIILSVFTTALVSLFTAPPLPAATQVVLREALEVKTETAAFKLPSGAALQVVEEHGGVLTCVIIGQHFQVPADQTDYREVVAKAKAVAVSPPSSQPLPAPAPADTNGLLDLPDTMLDADDILFSLANTTKDSRHIVPRNYDKKLGATPVAYYHYTLTADGIVVKMSIVTEPLAQDRLADFMPLLKEKFPVSKIEHIRQPHPAPVAQAWWSADKHVIIGQSITRDDKIQFSIDIHCTARANRDIKYHEFPAALEKFNLPALQYHLDIHQVSRQTALDLWHSPAAQLDQNLVRRISVTPRIARYFLASEPTKTPGLSTTVASNTTASIVCSARDSDLTRDILCLNLIDLGNLPKFKQGTNFSSQYQNFSPNYVVLDQPAAIPLLSIQDKDKQSAEFFVAIVTVTKKTPPAPIGRETP
jgi:hypothetical protein